MTTVEEMFEQFKKLPDWDRYPMPEVFYKHFNVKKPQPTTVNESIFYQPPAYLSLNENGKVEIREAAPGGVREIKDLQQLPVDVKRLNDETGELEEYPPILSPEEVLAKQRAEFQESYYKILESIGDTHILKQIKDRIGSYTLTSSGPEMLNPPIANNMKETQHVSDPPS